MTSSVSNPDAASCYTAPTRSFFAFGLACAALASSGSLRLRIDRAGPIFVTARAFFIGLKRCR